MLHILILLALQAPPRLEETIVVTAERLEQPVRDSTAAVTVLRGDDLRRLPARDLGEALRLVPGLQIIAVNPGAPPMLSSRGFFGAGEVEYVQLLVDGMPVGNPESGIADWRAIPIESIDHIEVLRGAGSSLFGDAALGGVVQVFTRRGTDAAISYGSFDTSRITAAYAAQAFHVSASAARSDGFRDHTASDETFANAGLTRGPWQAALALSRRDREDAGALSVQQFDDDPSASDPLFANDRDQNRRIDANVRYHAGNLDGNLDLLAHAHDRHGELTRTLLLFPGFGDTATRTLDTRSLGGSATRTFTIGNGRVLAGADTSYATVHSRYSADVDGRGSRRQGAAFVSGEWNVTPRARLAAGARYDAIGDEFENIEADDSAFSPRVALSLDLGHVTPYLQLSRAFKAPTLDQRFDQRPIPDFQGGTFSVANPGLVPQHATSAELGLRGRAGAAEWEAIAYRTTVDDEIDFDVRTFRYANIGRSLHRGLETSFAMPMTTNTDTRLSYTWTRVSAREGANRGVQLKNIAEHVLRAGFDVRTLVDLHLEIEHSAGRYLDDANRLPLDDATVVDLRIARTFGPFTAAVEATNLLGTQYAPLGLTLTGFAGEDVPYVYPAAGRSIAATLR
ncbi:MAG: vitamin transporter, partial [Acidobacteriota bacterium]|nr:vitamin transporter [Acidobacteriota bacterium]